jgi:hypothetical protein
MRREYLTIGAVAKLTYGADGSIKTIDACRQ